MADDYKIVDATPEKKRARRIREQSPHADRVSINHDNNLSPELISVEQFNDVKFLLSPPPMQPLVLGAAALARGRRGRRRQLNRDRGRRSSVGISPNKRSLFSPR